MTATLASSPATPRVASVDEIRASFPAMRRTHAGVPVAYLDGPGGTQVPQQVVEAMDDYLYHHNANTHWRYPTSEETDELIARSREAIAEFVNGRPDEIAFGQNMTSLTFHLARAIGRGLGRATRSSSRSSTITGTSRRGARWSATAESRFAP
jgi:selenocysteine lyase/cysteine desulfurase